MTTTYESLLKDIVENINTQCLVEHNWKPYKFSSNHNLLKWQEPKYPHIMENIFGEGERVLIDDNVVIDLLIRYCKKKGVKMDGGLIVNVYGEYDRKAYLRKCEDYKRERLAFIEEYIQQLLNQPKVRKEKLHYLLCKDVNNKYRMTEQEFETFFKGYSKAKKKETIQEEYKPWITPKPEKKKSFMDLLSDLSQTTDRELTFEEFRDVIRNFPTSELTSVEAYQLFLDMLTERSNITRPVRIEEIPSPFKTKKKNNHVLASNLVTGNVNRPLTDRFPSKDNRKYGLRTVAPHGLFIADLMFCKDYCYLIMIEVNTRKIYIEPTNIMTDGNYETTTKNKKNSELYLKALTSIRNRGADIRAIKGDGESAFISKVTQKYYLENNITFIPVERMKLANGHTDPSHTSLALIDRAIRTIRDMAYNSRIELTPLNISRLVDIYNLTPHSTLTQIMGFDVCPNDVASDKELETEIARRLEQQNYSIVHKPLFLLPEGTICRVFEEYDKFSKRRSQVKPDYYKVIGNNGTKYLLQNVNKKSDKLLLSRIKIDPINDIIMYEAVNLPGSYPHSQIF